jgi:hypothetical protein
VTIFEALFQRLPVFRDPMLRGWGISLTLDVPSSVAHKPLTPGDALSWKTLAHRHNIAPQKNRKLNLVYREFAVEQSTFEVWSK